MKRMIKRRIRLTVGVSPAEKSHTIIFVILGDRFKDIHFGHGSFTARQPGDFVIVRCSAGFFIESNVRISWFKTLVCCPHTSQAGVLALSTKIDIAVLPKFICRVALHRRHLRRRQCRLRIGSKSLEDCPFVLSATGLNCSRSTHNILLTGSMSACKSVKNLLEEEIFLSKEERRRQK
jgi:hypothetical protein